MSQRDRESVTDSDPHGLLFGPSDDDPGVLGIGPEPVEPRMADGAGRASRHDERLAASQRARRRRNRVFVLVLALLLIVVVGVAAKLIIPPIYNHFHTDDYSGSGTGEVVVTVQNGDGADAIGTTLQRAGVVASAKAFENAANADSNSQNIQPGSYRLRHHMSASSALTLLEGSTARLNADVLVTEGATVVDVAARLEAAPCASAKANRICGAGLSVAAVQKAMRDVSNLGVPSDFLVNGKTPTSAEGFLFPATYYFPSTTDPSDALGQMVTTFIDEARSINFTPAAQALHLTPYQLLIIASIAQSEAKYASDFPKVARVILNRLKLHIPLRIDATSAYAAKLAGKNPAIVNYALIDSPYNTYTHDNLPPTPVGNPGADAMKAVESPPVGSWLFYVNDDAQGHLGFYATEAQFEKARAACAAHHWGCA